MSGDNTNNDVNNAATTNNTVLIPTSATPNIVPRLTLIITGLGKTPEKFNGLDFKCWQQKTFCWTTLNLTTYLRED